MLFLGYSGSGKTTSIALLTRELAEHGKKVGTLKHIHSGSFTIDTKAKDTWLYSSSGASIVVAVAHDQIVVISKQTSKEVGLSEILPIFRRHKINYLFVEGWHTKLSRLRNAKRVICASTRQETMELLNKNPRPTFILGKFKTDQKQRKINGFPVLKLPRDIRKALALIDFKARNS